MFLQLEKCLILPNSPITSDTKLRKLLNRENITIKKEKWCLYYTVVNLYKESQSLKIQVKCLYTIFFLFHKSLFYFQYLPIVPGQVS